MSQPSQPSGLHFTVEAVDVETTWPLRLSELRPGGSNKDVQFVGDQDPDTMHFATRLDGTPVGVSSLYHTGAPWIDEPHDGWQIRGVATDPAYRRRGIAKVMMAACLQHAYDHDADIVWCNARIVAVPFYDSLGFQAHGGIFEIPGVGPHIIMYYEL